MGLLAATCILLSSGIVFAIAAFLAGQPVAWWAMSVTRFTLGTSLLLPVVGWSLGNAYWRNAEREWLSRTNVHRAS
jgi:hypothetical protein